MNTYNWPLATYSSPLTVPEMTTAKGVTIHPGDIVTAKGSTLERFVMAISSNEGSARRIHACRVDGGTVSHTTWMDAEKLTIVRKAGE